jgi:DNA-binding MltR family transcriptional regulator
MNESTFWSELDTKTRETLELFIKEFEKESDRAAAILAACILDDLLERIIEASYVKDRRVKSLFRNDHILQSLFAKINIAYFSGLIPSTIYHDLRLLCEIRNRFAHGVIADIGFTHGAIMQRIEKFALGPPLEDIPEQLSRPRMKFVLVFVQIATVLQWLELELSKGRPPHFVEVFKLNEKRYEEMALTRNKLDDLLRKKSSAAPPTRPV